MVKIGNNLGGLMLGGIFIGVYFGSSYLTKIWVMQDSEQQPVAPQYFRDIKVVTDDDKS